MHIDHTTVQIPAKKEWEKSICLFKVKYTLSFLNGIYTFYPENDVLFNSNLLKKVK